MRTNKCVVNENAIFVKRFCVLEMKTTAREKNR